MGVLLRAAVLGAIGTAAWLAAGTSFGQTAEPVPPAEGTEPAARGTEPVEPDGAQPVPILPPGLRPQSGPQPSMRGAGCDHSAPATGV